MNPARFGGCASRKRTITIWAGILSTHLCRPPLARKALFKSHPRSFRANIFQAMLCPICKKPVTLADSFMPFCSERCKIVDLGNWAMEKYVISSPVTDEEDDDNLSEEI